jgi:DNA-binding protein YbaB
MFDKAKNLYQLQRQAKQIKKELKNIHIEAEVEGIVVVIDGEQEVVSVTVSEEALTNSKKMQDNLVKAFNKAVKKSQQIAAEKMKGVMGGLGLAGT